MGIVCAILVAACAPQAGKSHSGTTVRPAPGQAAAPNVSPQITVGTLPAGIRPSAGEAFFEMDTILGDRFVFKLTDPARIRQAREILERKLPKRVTGRIVSTAQPYNKPWHFHLDPATIEFSYLTDDRCDAAIHYIEDHLTQVGERVLPGAHWCPLSSRLVRELVPAE